MPASLAPRRHVAAGHIGWRRLAVRLLVVGGVLWLVALAATSAHTLVNAPAVETGSGASGTLVVADSWGEAGRLSGAQSCTTTGVLRLPGEPARAATLDESACAYEAGDVVQVRLVDGDLKDESLAPLRIATGGAMLVLASGALVVVALLLRRAHRGDGR